MQTITSQFNQTRARLKWPQRDTRGHEKTTATLVRTWWLRRQNAKTRRVGWSPWNLQRDKNRGAPAKATAETSSPLRVKTCRLCVVLCGSAPKGAHGTLKPPRAMARVGHWQVRRRNTHRQPEVGETYTRFLEDYVVAFGEVAPVHIWPRPLPGVLYPSCNKCGLACDHKCLA